jgi:hypothetical protein
MATCRYIESPLKKNTATSESAASFLSSFPPQKEKKNPSLRLFHAPIDMDNVIIVVEWWLWSLLQLLPKAFPFSRRMQQIWFHALSKTRQSPSACNSPSSLCPTLRMVMVGKIKDNTRKYLDDVNHFGGGR